MALKKLRDFIDAMLPILNVTVTTSCQYTQPTVSKIMLQQLRS